MLVCTSRRLTVTHADLHFNYGIHTCLCSLTRFSTSGWQWKSLMDHWFQSIPAASQPIVTLTSVSSLSPPCYLGADSVNFISLETQVLRQIRNVLIYFNELWTLKIRVFVHCLRRHALTCLHSIATGLPCDGINVCSSYLSPLCVTLAARLVGLSHDSLALWNGMFGDMVAGDHLSIPTSSLLVCMLLLAGWWLPHSKQIVIFTLIEMFPCKQCHFAVKSLATQRR